MKYIRLTSQLEVALTDDGAACALVVTRPNGQRVAAIYDSIDDLRTLETNLHHFLSTVRTERERNALASSALDSIEAGTAPEEGSFTQGQLPPPSLGFEAYMKAKYGDSYIPFVGMSEIPTIQENWEQGPRPS